MKTKTNLQRHDTLFWGNLDKPTKEQTDYKLLLIPLIIGLIMFIIIDNVYTNKAIEKCVANGNDYNYCVAKLS